MSVAGEQHDFPVQSSKDIYVGRVMALRSDEVVMPGGRAAVREILEHPGAVAIAALDDDDRLMMIYQYGFVNSNYGAAAALSVMLALALALISIAYQFATRRWSDND